MWKKKSEALETQNPSNNNDNEFFTHERKPSTKNIEPATGVTAVTEKTKIGTSVLIKGDLFATEDIIIRGEFQGIICVKEHTVTIARSGNIRGDIIAKRVVIEGNLEGNIYASSQVDVRKCGSVLGNIVGPRVILEDGSTLKGNIDMDKASVEKQFPGSKPAVAKKQSSHIESPKVPPTAAIVKSPSSTSPVNMQSKVKPTQPLPPNEFKAKDQKSTDSK